MKYFHRPAREQSESIYLRDEFNKTLASSGLLTVSDSVRLDITGVTLTRLDGELLAMHADSACWAFLTGEEANVFSQLPGMSFGGLAQLVGDRNEALNFAAHLWRRGLLSLDGQRAVSADMFFDGPNYHEGNLVELLLTEKCNLACPYCLAGAHQKMPAMDEPLACRTIDLAFEMTGCDTIAFEFAGGEPFLKYRLMRLLVDYIRDHPHKRNRRIFLSIQTNATLLDIERVKWLKENDIQVGVSIDGGAQAQNLSRPQVNGKESFSLLMRGVELLKEHDVPFGGLLVLNRSNIDDPMALADFMLEHSIHGFRVNPVAYLGDARKNWATVGLDQDEIIRFMQTFMKYIADKKYMILEDNIHSMCNFLTSKQRRTRCMRSHCGAGDSFQSITANGDIYPCGRATQSPGLKLGNVFDDIESLSTPAMTSERIAEIRNRRPNQFDDCAVCNYRQLCQSGCSVQSWERYGTVSHKTTECQFYKTLYPWLMRWLCFDREAFAHLNNCRYFEGEGKLFDQQILGAECRNIPAVPVHAPLQNLWPRPMRSNEPVEKTVEHVFPLKYQSVPVEGLRKQASKSGCVVD